MTEHKVARPHSFAVISSDQSDEHRPFLTWFETEGQARAYAGTRVLNDAKAYTILQVEPIMDVLPQEPLVADLRPQAAHR